MTKKKLTAEQKVGEAVLQKSRDITVGTHTYTVAPPSVATLILASEAISLLPKEELDENKNIVEQTLNIAKDCRPFGDILAVMILGATKLSHVEKVEYTEEREIEELHYKTYLWGLFKKPVILKRTISEVKTKEIVVNDRELLAEQLMNELTPREAQQLFTAMIVNFEIGDFFGITTFLNGINLLRPKKVVEKN
jgi:hypothetical protein